MSAPILVTSGRLGQQVQQSPDALRPATSRSEDADCYQRDASYSPEYPSFDSLDGSSTDVNDVFEEEEVEGHRQEEGSPSLSQRIADQLEEFLSDHCLSEHPFLLKHVQKGRMGYVSLKLLTSFKKIRELTRDWRTTLAAARSSANLEVNQEGTKVRRLQPLPNWLQAEPTSKLLLVWNLLPLGQEDLQEYENDDHDEGCREQQDLMELALRMLGCHGSMASLRVLRAGQAVPTRLQRLAKCISAPVGTQPCVLVEYQHLEGARRAWSALGGRQGLGAVRVAMLRGRWPGDSLSQELEETVCDGICRGGACVQGMAPRKALRRSKRPGYRLEDSALCSESSESDFLPASPRPQRRVPRPQALYGSPLITPHPSSLHPSSNPYRNPASSPSSSPLLPCNLFLSLSHTHSPLATSPLSSTASSGDGTLKSCSSGDYSSQVFGGQARTGSWPQRWRKSQTQSFFPEKSGAGFAPSGAPKRRLKVLKVVRQPLGPDGTKGFYNYLGRGRIFLQP